MKRIIVILVLCLSTIFLMACTVERPDSQINEYVGNETLYCLVENLNNFCKEYFQGGLSYFSISTTHFECHDRYGEDKPKNNYYAMRQSDWECK